MSVDVLIAAGCFLGALIATLPLWPRLRRWNPKHGAVWIVVVVGVLPVLATRYQPEPWDAFLLPAAGGFLVAGLITRRRDLRAIRG